MPQSDFQLKNQAISAALSQNWEKAIELNQMILTNTPNEIAALNRLGFAQMRSGKISESKDTYNRVLEIDKFNPIAKKSLDRLANLKSSKKSSNSPSPTKMKTSFIEEPGRTKSVNLVRPAPGQTLSDLTVGLPVNLVSKKKRVCVETFDKDYVGTLPDDVGIRLHRLLKLGYLYEANIKKILDKKVSIFIKEVHRFDQARNVASFPSNLKASNHVSDSGRSLKDLESIPIDLTPTGEADDD